MNKTTNKAYLSSLFPYSKIYEKNFINNSEKIKHKINANVTSIQLLVNYIWKKNDIDLLKQFVQEGLDVDLADRVSLIETAETIVNLNEVDLFKRQKAIEIILEERPEIQAIQPTGTSRAESKKHLIRSIAKSINEKILI